ncbi:MAG: adenosylcobalamin-dependent ribonucleoside-diphosphate reductase, partial [Patescibacteria group bacterium]
REEDATNFETEMVYILIHQMGSPNSPQWFNTGLNWAYGITGPAQGHSFVEQATGEFHYSADAYTRPQPHACFIQSVRDDLVNPGGIMDLITREARIFKYGSGTGTNFSSLRGNGEPLSGGGTSSGLMSWLKIFDTAAGAVKSGGTTRRAAKMVILNMDHPDIETFIGWKAREEDKALALIREGYPSDFNSEAYQTISGQNSNNSVRVTDDFMKAVETKGDWDLRWRTDMNHIAKTVKAHNLWQLVGQSAWRCADPGVQYDTTINDWHTCPNSGRINGSNPCSEYMFLDDTACNLCSLNLMKYYNEETETFNINAFRHASRLWTIVLEISVAMAQFPSEEIARRSWEFRTLGLGYANLGTLLMVMGIPYDSDEGRTFAAALTAIMTGQSYATSAEIAKGQGPFPGYLKNKEVMGRVMRNHRRIAYAAADSDFENLHIIPPKINQATCPADLLAAVHETWDEAVAWGEVYGYRNAQTTLIAPTGTIGLQMDCDTTGVEPDFAMVKFKKLAGGGNFKIVNLAVPKALKKLGYTETEMHEIIEYAVGTGTLDSAPAINRETLRAKGLTDLEIDRVNKTLPGVFDIRYALNPATVGEETYRRLGFAEKAKDPNFDFLKTFGFTDTEIEQANRVICGTMTIEGAPHLKEEHLSIFDCANRCGRYGTRYLRYGAHLEMMGAVQPFLSGSISKTVNMPGEATVEQVLAAYDQGWHLALKSVALYRDGSKGSQPLSTAVQESEGGKKTEKVVETKIEYRPLRRKLPDDRQALTHKFSIAGNEGYVTIGLYDDGAPGEIFIKINKQGSILAGLMDSFAISVSYALQYGVPLSFLVNKFSHVRFEPSGFTKNPQIPIAKSIIDYIFRWMAIKFLPREEWQKIGIHFEENALEKTLDDQLPPPAETANLITPHPVDENRQLTMTFDPSHQAKVAFDIQGDSPICDTCNGIMVRSGTCYKCLGCGNTTGCS